MSTLMDYRQLANFHSLDTDAFSRLLGELGFAAGACYRVSENKLVFNFGCVAAQNEQWPAVISSLPLHYSAKTEQGVPTGWKKVPLHLLREHAWPHATFFYFPIQDQLVRNLLLAVVPKARPYPVQGRLEPVLEIVVRRIAFWLEKSDLCHFINDIAFDEEAKKVNKDLRNLIDHELRTPLSVIDGYASLLLDLSPKAEVRETAHIIQRHALQAVGAMEKINLILHESSEALLNKHEAEPIELLEFLNSVIVDVQANDGLVSLNGKKPEMLHAAPRGTIVPVSGVARLLRRAFWEVLVNAISHSSNGKVRVMTYVTDDVAVVEVEDDGKGVPPGHDELIFLKFFQGTNAQLLRRGHRGMGLGLYLARRIVEQHMGQLLLVRKTQGTGVFRFIIPLDKVSALKKVGS